MNFHVLTLFPEMIEQGAGTSILGRALKSGYITLNTVNIRDYTDNKHKKVDDYPYGGGAGMLMQAQPVYDAYRAVCGRIKSDITRVIYLTPQGTPFAQKLAEEFAKEKELIFLCGHYEGIDERVLSEIVTDYVSVGDYVLTGGELPAMIMIDAISRLVPGVLNNDSSAEIETFHNDLLEYPQYSRPEVWHGKKVPQVLLSGNHVKIREWRQEQSVRITKEKRPDLYEKYKQKEKITNSLLKKNKLLYMDMAENLRRGRGELLYAEDDGVIILDSEAETCMAAVFDESAAEKLVSTIPHKKNINQFVLHQECLLLYMEKCFRVKSVMPFRQAVYTKRTALPVSKDIKIKALNISYMEEILKHYKLISYEGYMEDRLLRNAVFGAFMENEYGSEQLVGFAGIHKEGSIGMLEVFEKYRRCGVASAIESYMINYHLSFGYTPYGDVVTDNEASFELQERLGLRISKEKLLWVST